MKLVLDEWIVREVIDTLYMANVTLLDITGLDSPQEVAKKSVTNETAITRRIDKAIDLIQQSEQPKVDLVAELKHHLATTPKEQLEKEWKELEPWGNIGPTVQEFLYGKQPEVDDLDLEAKIENEVEKMVGTDYFKQLLTKSKFVIDVVSYTARHFAEWGATHLNARKEE